MRPGLGALWAAAVGVVGAAAVLAACASTEEAATVCEPDATRCKSGALLVCAHDGAGYMVKEDCAGQNKICHADKACVVCKPGQYTCKEQSVVQCADDGSGYLSTPVFTCDGSKGMICRDNGCVDACTLALKNRSYQGCEYWAVDLDNAVVATGNAASQQFAVALSNPSHLSANVTVSINEAGYAATPKLKTVKQLTIKPQGLEVLSLPAREVDGSAAGTYDTGGGTAVTTAAYKITSHVPIIAYQFNPLSNVGVFSNDASLLVPVSALSTDSAGQVGAGYLVMGWPQTLAKTSDPDTNSDGHLRAFLTIVGTRASTSVEVTLATDTVGDLAGIVGARKKGDKLTFSLDPYEVLNLETGGFGADFTGTRVKADKPVAVFSGSEASDVPNFATLATRRCCADHLEEQLFPTTTFGKVFVAIKTPSRVKALSEAGAKITAVNAEKEYFRVLSGGEMLKVATSLPSYSTVSIADGKFQQLTAEQDFTIEANGPVAVGQFVAGQAETGIPSSLPGGDPSFILLPPVEQFRTDYLFLTPDKYAFDFILIAAPRGAKVTLDGRTLANHCDTQSGKKLCCTVREVGSVTLPAQSQKTLFDAYRCQLSFPKVISGKIPPDNLEAGSQNDGVHRLKSDKPVGLVVYGFDAYVSYGYPGGTDLALINIK